MRSNRVVPWVMLSVLVMPKLAIANLEFDIKGVNSALEKNVSIYLDAISESEKKLNFRLEFRVKEEATKALQALGYYHSTFKYSVKDIKSDTDATVVLDIHVGPAVYIAKVDIKIEGEASSDPAFISLLKKRPIIGDILDQGKYDSLKASIQSLAIRRGYFDGKYSVSRLEVASGRNEAFLILHFNSGQRYLFGQVSYKNSQINESRLNSMRTFKEGDPYLVTDLGAFNQQLSNAGWFSSALVEAELSKLHQGKVPISVLLDPAPRNRFETGAGYSTDTGARLKLAWNKPWFNSRGNSLDTNLYVSRPQQKLESTFKIPLQNVLRDFYQVRLGLENLDNNNTQSLELTASLSRHWKYDNTWQRIVYLRWLYSDFTQAQVSDISNLALPGVNFSRIRNRGGSMPFWGDKQSITFEMSNPIWGSDIALYRLLGESVWIRSLNRNNRILLRSNFGHIYTKEFKRVPPSLRFFVGGDNSIRGYAYESISSRDSQGQLEGSSYMVTGSLEYNYRVLDNWWGAIFTDGGDAWTKGKPEWKTSVGVGVRWESPIGPIRADIAHGFENKKEKFTIHINFGPIL